MLYQSSERIAMSSNQDFLTGFEFRRNSGLPIWQHTLHNVLQTFAPGHFVGGQVLVARIGHGIIGRIDVDKWRAHVVATTPLLHLFLTKFFDSLDLIESRETPVMAFIETPTLVVGNP